MTKCSYCGSENPETAGACFECCTKLEAPKMSAVDSFFQDPTLSPLVVGTFFPKRIGRLSYILRLLLVLLLLSVSFFGTSMIFLGVVVVGYFYCCVVMPRLRDFGLPDLTIVLFFIPILNALLLLCLMIGPQDYWHTLRRKPH